jgi:hypothetical protein
MKYVLMAFIIFLCGLANAQTTQSPDQIRQQMAKIRQTTNWDDPAAAKKANEQIRELAKKLMAGNSMSGAMSGQQQQGGSTNPKDAQKLNNLNQEMSDYKLDLVSQIWKAAAGGENADFLLAEPLRKEIVQEFKDDESSEVKSVDWLESMTCLQINASMPGVQEVIDQMPAYKGIKILIITCDKKGTIVDLNSILSKAKDYPLEELHILNFGINVSTLPSKIGDFTSLKKLSLLNNNIRKLPPTVAKLTALEILYTDLNPIQTISQEISGLKALKQLGIAKTSISDDEITKIREALPNCQILR